MFFFSHSSVYVCFLAANLCPVDVHGTPVAVCPPLLALYVIASLFSCHASHKGVVSQVQTGGRKEIQSAGRKKLKTFASKFPLRGARTE